MSLYNIVIRLCLVITMIVAIASYTENHRHTYWSSSLDCLVSIITLGLLWRKKQNKPEVEPVLTRSVYWVGSLLAILAFASLGIAIFAPHGVVLPWRVLIGAAGVVQLFVVSFLFAEQLRSANYMKPEAERLKVSEELSKRGNGDTVVRSMFCLSIVLGLMTTIYFESSSFESAESRFFISFIECLILSATLALLLWRWRYVPYAKPAFKSAVLWTIAIVLGILSSVFELLLLSHLFFSSDSSFYFFSDTHSMIWEPPSFWGGTFASSYARICVLLLLSLERERFARDVISARDAEGFSAEKDKASLGKESIDSAKTTRVAIQILFLLSIIFGLTTAYYIGPFFAVDHVKHPDLSSGTANATLSCGVLFIIVGLILWRWRFRANAKPTFGPPLLWIVVAALGIFTSVLEFLALNKSVTQPLMWVVIASGCARLGVCTFFGLERRHSIKCLIPIGGPEPGGEPAGPGGDLLPDTTRERVGSVETLETTPTELAPTVPEDLLSAFSTGSCVLFAGGGISAQAGVPLWSDGWSRVLDEATKEDPSKNWDNLRNALREGEIVALVDLLRGRLSQEDLARICGQVFSGSSQRQPTLYSLIRDIPFSGVLTTAWDKSLENALQRRRPTTLTANDSGLFGQVLREKQFYLLKLNGDLSRPETLLFTVKDYQRALYEREEFSQFLGSLALSNTLLFAGASLTTIDDFFSGMRFSQGARRHFALVPKQSRLDFESERFLSRYGVELLGYNATDEHLEVERFLSDLYDQILRRPELRDAIRFEAGTLDRVLLQNIGPFQQLNLEMRSSWNVLLGNNGCGKSSILKAIALGLCGDDASARQLAAKLLNSKADKGSVELWFGNQKFVTTLIRGEGRKVSVKSEQLTPFRTGRWLVLGFPPLRGVSQHSPAGPNDKAGMPNPDISDLLPLIDGAVDARLDSIKQWIINTYLRSELADKQKESLNKSKQLLESFFKVLGELTPDVECRFKSVDSSTWEVIVTTDDGDVPIDYISQGTNSIFGWVGILLQRLYEVFPNAADPEKQHALVLADEIDAHMHPAWQQSLLSALGRIFPGVQFITTTHSPLIVGGLSADNVFRFARDDDGKVIRLEIAPDMTMGRADQILTTPLFSLNTTLDTETQATAERYRILLGRSQRTASEEEEFQNLRETLQFRIPPPHVDLEERRAAVRERESLVREAREKLSES